MTEESLFAAALEVEPAERAALLERQCHDPGLRRRVELSALDVDTRSDVYSLGVLL